LSLCRGKSDVARSLRISDTLIPCRATRPLVQDNNLENPHVIAAAIVEGLRAELEEFELILGARVREGIPLRREP
jgi:hypothetical protein